MNDTDIIEQLRTKLGVSAGRHLYGILGTYASLKRFAAKLQQATTPEGLPFPAPLSVTKGILDNIPDGEFRELVEREAKRPETVAKHVTQAFEQFLRAQLHNGGLIVLERLEILFAYHSDLAPLRVLASDMNRIVLLLPGKREKGLITLFPEQTGTQYIFPNLIAENHIWELKD